MVDANDRSERAEACFRAGYNCAQAVLLAFCDETGLDTTTAARVSSAFGGGMGRMREVCGAVSGMFLALGLLRGYDDPKVRDGKSTLYAETRALADRFRGMYGSIICRELLVGASGTGGTEPAERTDSFYKKRPCVEYVASAARFVAEALNEHECAD